MNLTHAMRFASIQPRPMMGAGGGFTTSRGDRFAAQQANQNTIKSDDWRYAAR